MKGKGKGKDVPDIKDCPLKFPDFSPLDPAKYCPVYWSIVPKPEEEDEEGGSIGIGVIDDLQFELETLLVSVVKRQEELEAETKILTAWQENKEKKPAAEKSDSETSGKRKNTSDDKPAKQAKDSDGNAIPSSSIGRPKTKNSQSNKTEDYEMDESSSETTKPQKSDVSSRFWASLEPYFAEITQEHLKFLEDWIKSHEDDEEYFQIPDLGKHYSYEWSSKEVQEEQTEGIKANEKPKESSSSSSISSSSISSSDPEEALKKAEKECSCSDCDEDYISEIGPLAERLVSCLIEEQIMPSLEDTIETSAIEISATETSTIETSAVETSTIETSTVETSTIKTSTIETSVIETSTIETSAMETSTSEILTLETSTIETSTVETSAMETFAMETSAMETSATETSATETSVVDAVSELSDEVPEITMTDEAKENFLNSLNIGSPVELEIKLRKVLEEEGFLEPDETSDSESDSDSDSEDAVLAELQGVQEALRVIIEYNLSQKQKLLQLAKNEIARQEIRKKLQQIDSQILEYQRKKQNKKCPPTKKDKDQVLRILKEREILVEQLESTGNICL